MIGVITNNELYTIEEFLSEWSQISSFVISLINIVISIIVLLLIYLHQCRKTMEKTRQSVISIIEEVERECNAVNRISELCEQAQGIGVHLENLSDEDDYVKAVQIAKRRLSEFK